MENFRIHRMIMWVSLLLNILIISTGICFLLKKGGITPVFTTMHVQLFDRTEVRSESCDYYSQRVDLFNNITNQKNDVVFIGDSITERMNWQELTRKKSIINRGIAGDDTQGILLRLNEITEICPSQIFLMCGINDLQGGALTDEILKRYKNILRGISSNCPKTEVFVQGILPIHPKKYTSYVVPTRLVVNIPNNDTIHDLNKRLKDITVGYNNIHYLNLSDLVGHSGELKSTFTCDGLHLNGEGMLVWAAIIQQKLYAFGYTQTMQTGRYQTGDNGPNEDYR